MFDLYLQYTNIPQNTNEFHAMVRVSTESILDKNIPAKNVLYLLDVSGSVDIKMVKQSIIHSIPFLREKDEVSVISFSTETSVDVPWTKCTYSNKTRIANDVLNIKTGGWSNISNGIFHAIEQCMDRDAHIIVLTDGAPNSGITNASRLVNLVKNTIHGTNTRIHAFGYGNHETEFLRELTDACDGTYNYIHNYEELPIAYGSVLGAAMSTVFQGLTVSFESKTLMFTDTDNRPMRSQYIGDVYAGETKDALFKCHRIREALDHEIIYRIKAYDLINDKEIVYSSSTIIKSDNGTMEENKMVSKRIEELRVVNRLKEARKQSSLEKAMDILRHTNTPLKSLQEDLDLLISSRDCEYQLKSLMNRVEQEYRKQRDNRSDDLISEYYTPYRLWTSREVSHN